MPIIVLLVLEITPAFVLKAFSTPLISKKNKNNKAVVLREVFLSSQFQALLV